MFLWIRLIPHLPSRVDHVPVRGLLADDVCGELPGVQAGGVLAVTGVDKSDGDLEKGQLYE